MTYVELKQIVQSVGLYLRHKNFHLPAMNEEYFILWLNFRGYFDTTKPSLNLNVMVTEAVLTAELYTLIM